MTSKKLTQEDVSKIIKLARLEPEEDKLEKLTNDFNAILGYVEKLAEVDTKDVPAMNHVHGAENIFREDIKKESFNAEDMLANTPDRSGTYIRVPLVIEQE